MPENKLTQCLYISWSLLGTLTSITSTAVAQTGNEVTPDVFTAEDATLPSTSHTLTKHEPTSHTWSETSVLAGSIKPETRLSSETIESEHTLTSFPEPDILATIEPLPHTEAKASSLDPTANPEPETQTPLTAENLPIRVSPRVGANFSTGPGVGYSSSFGGIEGFLPLWQTPGSNLTFLEGRLLLSTEDANVGGNIIMGHRIYDANANRVLGGYIAYEYRSTEDSSFNQIGAGFESLGEFWDVRGNAYVPVGDTRQQASETTSNLGLSVSDPFFQGNFLAVSRNQQQQINRRYEAAMAGVDIEAGVKVASLGQTGDLRGYAGLYYYDAPDSDGVVGWRTRLEARPTDMLRLGLSLSNDDRFGTNVVLSIGANFPGTRPRGLDKQEQVLARLAESPQRNFTIVVDEQVESELLATQETVLIMNPDTGEPWRFRHTNLGIGMGDGTFENPTGTVAQALSVAQPNDIVYVQPGTNPGIAAFAIPDGVQVLSTGPVQQINTEELSLIQLPLSGAGVLPEVTGTVTMGNDTTLSGFALNGIPGAGITGRDISTIIIRENAIANAAAEGIALNNVTGQITLIDNTIRNSGGEGFNLSNNLGQVELRLVGTTITDNGSSAPDGDGVNLELRNNASGTFDLINNTIVNNRSSGGLADGLDIKLFDNTSGIFNLADNTISNNQLNGLSIDLEATALGTINLTNNAIAENQMGGVALLVSQEASGTFNLIGNTISNNQFKGVGLTLNDQTLGSVNLTDNTITENLDDGVFVQLSDQAQWEVNLSNNSIVINETYGVFVNANDGAILRFLSDSNLITNNVFTGVSLTSNQAAGILAVIQSNTLTEGGFSDLEAFTFAPDATICLQPSNNKIGFLLLDDSFGGSIQVEEGTLPSNTISTNDVTFWSGTTVASGTCKAP
ncbi:MULTISPECIES: right-handed parallel beta-helix repeat-containing protein [unclassified Coleofasciculus]|uniref:right-handed parallel beta-helix repeat-containing protein n=1 Tax=unclassified Coleofasciculus TaxID=2692782 RepID=UPI00188156AE|nr:MULTISPECIES: right-handed parallel beta-helix repeat-containing protein [unclassified Coleofasciculus]MBE9127253.1 right-handed parallel beta-helix repeat-containing protein [Coleofasciculus sp. LEGE 07081]MBE9150595.1 right-handed parallel beta-helix repeat-containing protein [Coleofasciculus sp. LEGE 07092]